MKYSKEIDFIRVSVHWMCVALLATGLLIWTVGCGSNITGNDNSNASADGGGDGGGSAQNPELDPGKVGPARTWEVMQRACPNQLHKKPLVNFQGKPCDKGQSASECQSTCLPEGVVTNAVAAGKTFFSDCSKEEVLCVGRGKEVTTLRAASQKVQSNPAIQTIKIAKGQYNESFVLVGLKRDLTIEGESNDAQAGVRIVAPLPSKPTSNYAALQVSGVGQLKVVRVVLSGYGHGLFVNDFVSVNIDQNHHTANLLSGALIRGSGPVTITRSRFEYNGGVLYTQSNDLTSVNIDQNHRTTGTGTLSVNIDQNHRLWGKGSISVNIDQNHRIPGLSGNSVAVNIDQNHRGVRQRSTYVKALRFGLAVVGSGKVLLESNRFSHNALGGARLSPEKSDIAVNIDQNHRGVTQSYLSSALKQGLRVAGSDTVAVNIDQNHRVVLQGNVFQDNGPRGWFARSGAKTHGCSTTCGSGYFCEQNVCLPNLHVTPNAGERKGQLFVAGVGALVAGSEKLELKGNVFFRNDMNGLVAHSISTLTMEENVLERNGVRPGVLQPRRFLLGGAEVWGVESEIVIKHNLVVENATHGVHITNNANASSPLRVDLFGNYIAGAGAFLDRRIQNANGVWLVNLSQAQAMSVSLRKNYFINNLRSGLSTSGFVVGEIKDNDWLSHPNRAVVIHDTHPEPSKINQLSFLKNVISGATGYGLQIYGGAARILVHQNLFEGVQVQANSNSAEGEADALNLVNLTQMVEVLGNLIRESRRAGIFVSQSRVRAERNLISGCKFATHSQDNSTLMEQNNRKEKNGSTTSRPTPDSRSLPTRKDF